MAPMATKNANPTALFSRKLELLAEMGVGKLPSNSIMTITPKIPVTKTLIEVPMSITFSIFYEKYLI